MTLTQQFLLISILPLCLVGMVVYLWRAKMKRRRLFTRWSLTLIVAAIWASSVLRFFGGATFPSVVTYNWGFVGKYALSLTAVLLLLTTFVYLSIPRSYSRVALIISIIVWGGSIGLDPVLWQINLPEAQLVGQAIRQFDIWASIWVASWIIPIIAAWMLVQQINARLPKSSYRNQVHYWLLVLACFFVGSALGSVQQPAQPGWQQAGVIVIILGALTGTLSFTQSTLPDLQLALRNVLSRLSGTLIIFGLTWVALSLIVRLVTALPVGTSDAGQNLILGIAAALFAILFSLVYRFVNDVTRRIFVPSIARQETVMADYANVIGNLPEPVQLGQLFLRVIQSNLTTDDAWFFLADDGPGGKLILRPLTSLGTLPRETLTLDHASPMARHLRQNGDPLVQYDIDTMDRFENLPQTEREILDKWERVVYKPLHAGDSLVGVLALGAKYSGESYDQKDFDLLQLWAEQISPLLAQAQNLASLQQINNYVFRHNQVLAREKRHLRELVNLYALFLELISPDLRQPFTAVNKEIQQFQSKVEDAKLQQSASQLSQQVAELSSPIDNLITMSSRIQMRHQFNFQPVNLDDLAQEVIRNLRSMAEARRVTIEFNSDALGPVLGDEEQLSEAIQQLLHNAIKFNKIGGAVQVECGVEGSQVFLRVVDTGVGIPAERLDNIWAGFTALSKNGHARAPGLGLVLTRFIVNAHGGHIEAQSKYGSGSVFTIRLPLIFED
jgi:signal transduction histidine kinase